MALLLPRVIRLLPVVFLTAFGAPDALLFGVDHQAHVREGVHHGGQRAQLLALGRGSLEGEVRHGFQRGHQVLDRGMGIGLVQAKEKAQDLKGGIDPRPDEGHEQPGLQVVAGSAAAPGSAQAGQLVPLGGGAGLAALPMGALEVDKEGIKLRWGVAGEAAKRRRPATKAGIGDHTRGFAPREAASSVAPQL